jgi:HEAT repeat protein
VSCEVRGIDWSTVQTVPTGALINYLRNPASFNNRDVRHEALRELGERRSPQAFAVFVELLGGELGIESDLAAAGLAQLGDRAAIPHLERAYAEARREAAMSSISLGSIEFRPIGMLNALMWLRSRDELVRLLRAGEQPVERVLAAQEIGRRSDRSTTGELEQAQTDPCEYVRAAAGEALEQIRAADAAR